MILTLPAATIEYLHVDVTGAPEDIVESPVDVALTHAGAAPAEDDWQAAQWAPEKPSTVRWLSQGLAPARYDVWVRIIDSPETPVRMAGGLILT